MRCWPLSILSCSLAVWSVIGLLIHYGPAASQTAENNISFLWAFVARTGVGDTQAVAITQDTTLHTGDQFKMIVELQTPCFVYVLHGSKNTEGTEGEVTWLFPYHKPQFVTDYQVGKRYDIPPRGAWYSLSPPAGRATIYLLASTQRLSDLEALLEASAAASPAQRSQLTARILAEVRAPRQVRPSPTPGERPVRIGGSVRGGIRGKDFTDFAVEIRALHFYSKTFTLAYH
jgi:Domain of unknown function (DUF4384)